MKGRKSKKMNTNEIKKAIEILIQTCKENQECAKCPLYVLCGHAFKQASMFWDTKDVVEWNA